MNKAWHLLEDWDLLFWYVDPENINLPYGQLQDKLMSTTKLLSHAYLCDKSLEEWTKHMSSSSSTEHLRYYKTNITYYHIQDPRILHVSYTNKRNINNKWKEENYKTIKHNHNNSLISYLCFCRYLCL